jgi:hypothetical protein
VSCSNFTLNCHRCGSQPSGSTNSGLLDLHEIVFRKKNWSHPRANRGRINLKVDSAVDLAESLGVRSGSDQNCQAKNRIVVKSGSPVTPYSHLEGNFNSGTDSKNSSNSPEVGGPFLLLRAIPSSEPFNGKQFDSHAIEHLLELAG